MRVQDFDYELPEELIAQHPIDKRAFSRMLVLHKGSGKIEHQHFYDILKYLKCGDCLVMNDSKVIPARLFGIKESTGAKIEILLIKRIEGDSWQALVRPGKRLKLGDRVSISEEEFFQCEIVGDKEDGTRMIEFHYEGVFQELLDRYGRIPLPPYINRNDEEQDKERYQTVYCKEEGSVAAPTAGLHFTDDIINQIRNMGVQIVFVTLHVGIGTFRPVKVENVEEHLMHYEEYSISHETADVINQAKTEGRRVICIGTTSARTLESAAGEDGKVQPGMRSTNLYIYPPYQFRVMDGLVSNFHLPKSTLLMLVSAFYNREKILEAYQIAVQEKYRFFSYGDCMLIL